MALFAKKRVTRIEKTVSTAFGHPAAVVWPRLEDPSLATLTDDAVFAGRIESGPRGVGEVQAFVMKVDGEIRGAMIEIVEYEPGRRAVSRTITEQRGINSTSTEWIVEPTSEGRCQVSVTSVMDLGRRGVKLTPVQVDQIRGACSEWMSSILTHLHTDLDRIRAEASTDRSSRTPAAGSRSGPPPAPGPQA